MTFSPSLGSSLTHTRMRTPENISSFSGMCAVCTASCIGNCEIGLSAIRGAEAIYPYQSNINQFASEKDYPLDFSHFNINGRVFGAMGCAEDADIANVHNINLETDFGIENKIKLKAPFVFPAIAKLNWKDYFAGAGMAGLLAVIGEEAIGKDENLVLEDNKVVDSPLLGEMVSSFRDYYRGYGDIVLQANYDDERLGVLEYAIRELGVKTVELKFGQAAKGIQAMATIDNIEDALKYQSRGYLIYPNPEDPDVAENFAQGVGPLFKKLGKLPMWEEEELINRVAKLRELGAERVCFKFGPYDPRDIIKVLKIASKAGVDLVTFDSAGGGTGDSPTKMMNEWGSPTIYMESMVYKSLKALKEKDYSLPQVAIAGGFVMEDQIFKGLALGAPFINLVAIGRAAMAAAMVGKQVGDLIKEGKVPKEYQRFGSTIEEIYKDIRELKEFYGDKATEISPGAIGLYSYVNRITMGIKQLMALNRKFTLENIDRRDIVPLTELAAKVTGLSTYNELLDMELEKL